MANKADIHWISHSHGANVRRAEELKLAVAVDLIVYGANCRTCKETRRIDLRRLAETLGPDFLGDSAAPECSNVDYGR